GRPRTGKNARAPERGHYDRAAMVGCGGCAPRRIGGAANRTQWSLSRLVPCLPSCDTARRTPPELSKSLRRATAAPVRRQRAGQGEFCQRRRAGGVERRGSGFGQYRIGGTGELSGAAKTGHRVAKEGRPVFCGPSLIRRNPAKS